VWFRTSSIGVGEGSCHYFDNRFKSFVRKGLFKEEKVFAKVEIANTEFPTKLMIDTQVELAHLHSFRLNICARDPCEIEWDRQTKRKITFQSQNYSCDISFPGVRQNWYVGRVYRQLGSGYGDGTVRNEVWCCDLCSEGGK
jgi:hypothetical protein